MMNRVMDTYHQGKAEQLQKIRQTEGAIIVLLHTVQTHYKGKLHGVDCCNYERNLFMQESILKFYIPSARDVMSALV
jgi:hypothetical protein